MERHVIMNMVLGVLVSSTMILILTYINDMIICEKVYVWSLLKLLMNNMKPDIIFTLKELSLHLFPNQLFLQIFVTTLFEASPISYWSYLLSWYSPYFRVIQMVFKFVFSINSGLKNVVIFFKLIWIRMYTTIFSLIRRPCM